MKYKKGDIVFASKYCYPDGSLGNRHLFVVIGIVDGKIEAVTEEYISLIVSSQRQKGNDVSKFKYNEPLDKSSVNKLRFNSIVKCDDVIFLDESNIEFKVGEVTEDELMKFIDMYIESVDGVES